MSPFQGLAIFTLGKTRRKERMMRAPVFRMRFCASHSYYHDETILAYCAAKAIESNPDYTFGNKNNMVVYALWTKEWKIMTTE